MADTNSTQAGNTAAARKRERIGILAARTAKLEGRNAERFIRYVSDSLILTPQTESAGTVRSLKDGLRLEYIRQVLPFLLVPVVCAFLLFSAPGMWPALVFSTVLALAFGVAVRFARIWNWRTNIALSGTAVPAEIGTAITVRSDRLIVGPESMLLDDVKLETVELRTLYRPRIVPSFRINQLGLSTGKGPLLLDVRLIENGQQVVDTLCDKLVG